MSPWSFYQWGLDILGPLPEGPGKLKYIIVRSAEGKSGPTTGSRSWNMTPIQMSEVREMEDQADQHSGSTPAGQWPRGKSQ
ncbi:hypothetical protein Tco_0523439 [Tanacetum coccineum]